MEKKIEKKDIRKNTDKRIAAAKPVTEGAMTNKQSFEDSVKKAMDECVKDHKHNHPLYQETCVRKHIIDDERKLAVWVLFEQIDTDRCSPESDGWLGDQFRYSLWCMKDGKKPAQLFEDHAYIRRTKSALIGGRGRDCSIDLVSLEEDGAVIGITPEGVEGGTYAKKRILVTFNGKVKEPKLDILEAAKDKVSSIGPRLGYDYVRDAQLVKGRSDVAVVVWGCENGSDYGYDVLYLMKKAGSGVTAREIDNTRSTKSYIHLKEAKVVGSKVVITYRGDGDNEKYETEV